MAARLSGTRITGLTLALVFRRTATTIAARALAGIAAEALLRIGVRVFVGHMAFLFFASVVVIPRNHGNVSQVAALRDRLSIK
jgi:hypothetical protein